VHDAEGLNTGTWPIIAADQLVTPVERFFTRSHAAVPVIDASNWWLEVDGLVDRPQRFTLEELHRRFSERSVTATLVCAGLRRAELLASGPLPGELPWGPEPVSTGLWTGVALGDLLDAVGVDDRARHVEFTGLDHAERLGNQFGFGGSIELEKARSDEVLLATDLNQAPLPAAHGYPLRAVVPGWIGARSVKWLGRITLREAPSENYFQSQAYRIQREVSPDAPRDVSAGVALRGVPLNAMIVTPAADAVVAAGPVGVRGWAMGSEGRPLTSIELSPNGGGDWLPARIVAPGSHWTWTFWEAVVNLEPGGHLLVARAVDGSGAAQPQHLDEAWNVKGYNNNAWHRVPIVVEPKSA
jgi:sulfite oxidase